MASTEAPNAVIQSAGTLERLVQVLGFHDLTSFIISLVFVAAALAFVISGLRFLVLKRRERRAQLEEIVREVQSEPKSKLSQLRLEEEFPAEPALAQLNKAKAPTSDLPKPNLPESDLPKPKLPESDLPKPKLPETELSVPKPEPSLKAALTSTRGGFMAKLSALFSARAEISEEDFLSMEAILFGADIGAKTAQSLLDHVRDRVKREGRAEREFVKQALKDEMKRIFLSAKQASIPAPESDLSGALSDTPWVVMMVGVNGAGKTTSIGKLGAQYKSSGKQVYFGAGDTFRAAAVEQLRIWSERVGAVLVSGKENSDSASVLFDAISQAKKAQADVVLLDTAGRLHTKTDLMDELKKVERVVNKAMPGAPHEVLLVIDATMGQNALVQAREFAAATHLSGVILSKLDGTAKGGIALGIVNELKVPIRYVGIGERIEDLREFDPEMFVNALFD